MATHIAFKTNFTRYN